MGRSYWTEDQVKSLQRRLKVWPSGNLEHETWTALTGALDMPKPVPKPDSLNNSYSVRSNLLYKGNEPVSWKATPNLSSGVITPKLIVIHYTGTNSDQSALNWLTQSGSGVSCHLLVTKTGVVWQMAKFNRRAWHAGRSYYSGMDDGKGFATSDVNGCSVGIENIGLGALWPELQIEANIGIIKALMNAYPTIIDIVGHEDVATPAGRKADPGPGYPWDKVLKECGVTR